MNHHRARRGLSLLLLATAGVPVAACGSASPAPTATSTGATAGQASQAASGSPTPTTSTSSPSSASTPAAVSAAQALITQVALRDADLANGFTLKLIPSGDAVDGQITLDNCGYRFTSEAYRIARRQTEMVDSKGASAGVSNEVVAYDTPAHAALALKEWQDSVAHCKLNADVTPPEAGAPVVRYNLENIRHEPHLPVAANGVTNALMTIKATGKKNYAVDIMQQGGQILDILWMNTPTAPPDQQVKGLLSIAALTGKRLAGQ